MHTSIVFRAMLACTLEMAEIPPVKNDGHFQIEIVQFPQLSLFENRVFLHVSIIRRSDFPKLRAF